MCFTSEKEILASNLSDAHISAIKVCGRCFFFSQNVENDKFCAEKIRMPEVRSEIPLEEMKT